MITDSQQFICTSGPFCLCVGEVNAWDECSCFAQQGEQFAGARKCVSCGAPMIAIDFEIGEEVQEVAA